MLFRKTPTNYLRKLEREYNRTMLRRKERLLYFLENDAPIEIIVREIELVRQPFHIFIWKKFKGYVKFKFKSLFSAEVLYRMI